MAVSEQLIDGIAAVVNDEIITISEVHEVMAAEVVGLTERYHGDDLKVRVRELYRNTLQPLINVQLQLERAQQLNLKATDEDVAFHLDRLKQENQLSDTELQKMLRSRGLTLESYRKQIRSRLLVAKVVNAEVRSRLVILDTELQEAYRQRQDQYRVAGELTVSHILFLAPENGSMEADNIAKQKAAEVLAQLRQGANFVALAKAYSEGPSAERDGLLGTFQTGDLLPEFEEVVVDLKPGEISDLVRTRVGWHIIRLEDAKASGSQPFEAVRESLRTELLRMKTEMQYTEWVESLRRQAYIKILYDG